MKKLLVFICVLFLSLQCYALEVERQKNVATVIIFPLWDSTTTTVLQSSATALDSEIDQFSDSADNPDGFADCTNEATEIGATGQYYLILTQAEMNEDYIIVQIKASDAITQTILIRTTIGDPLNYATTDDGGTINVTGGAIDTTTTNTDMVSEPLTAQQTEDTVWDAVITKANHNVANSAGKKLRQVEDTALLREEEQAQGGSASTITLHNDASSITGFYDDAQVVIVSDLGVGQSRHIHAYVGSTRVASITPDWITTPDATSDYVIKADSEKHVHEIDTDAISAAAVADAAWQELIELFFDFDATATYATANAGSVVKQIADNAGVATALSTTVGTGDTSTSFTLTAGTPVAIAYPDMQITVTDGNGNTSTETRRISTYTSGRIVTVDTAFSFTPAPGDVAVIERAYLGVSVSGGDATQAKQDIIILAVKTNAAGTDIAADIIALKVVADAVLVDTAAMVAVDTDVATSDSTTSFTLTAGKASDDAFNGMLISVTDADDSNVETRRIEDYTSGRVVTVDRAFSFTPAVSDVVRIWALPYDKLAAIAGGTANTYIVTDTGAVGGTAIPDVAVWLTIDSAGARLVTSGLTDDNGEVIFYLDTGITYYVWMSKSGWSFSDNGESWVAE